MDEFLAKPAEGTTVVNLTILRVCCCIFTIFLVFQINSQLMNRRLVQSFAGSFGMYALLYITNDCFDVKRLCKLREFEALNLINFVTQVRQGACMFGEHIITSGVIVDVRNDVRGLLTEFWINQSASSEIHN